LFNQGGFKHESTSCYFANPAFAAGANASSDG
jgi:hypothetical protein